jgi:hypothetical protein
MQKEIKDELYKIEIFCDQLPICIVFKSKERKKEKEYVLKTNKKCSKLLLVKKEY